jgi:hypothetical protein
MEEVIVSPVPVRAGRPLRPISTFPRTTGMDENIALATATKAPSTTARVTRLARAGTRSTRMGTATMMLHNIWKSEEVAIRPMIWGYSMRTASPARARHPRKTIRMRGLQAVRTRRRKRRLVYPRFRASRDLTPRIGLLKKEKRRPHKNGRVILLGLA